MVGFKGREDGGLREGGVSMPSFHTVEILDASIRGVSVEELFKSRE